MEKKFQGLLLQPPAIELKNDIGAGDSFFAGWLYADGKGLEFEESLVKATAVAVARCEVERPWNLRLERIEELEQELVDQKDHDNREQDGIDPLKGFTLKSLLLSLGRQLSGLSFRKISFSP